MTKVATIFFIITVSLLSLNIVNAQCTPGNAETCPDPEGNGEVCPDSLPNGIIDVNYNEEFTILPPPYYVTPELDTIVFHHLQLMDVANLPPGLTWEANAENNDFYPGIYYCVLMDGIPIDTGYYVLKITVDVYVEILPGFPPVLAGTAIDSTSLALIITEDYTGLHESMNKQFELISSYPNPFEHTTKIGIEVINPEMFTLDVIDLLGNNVYSEKIYAGTGENYFVFDGSFLPGGVYIYSVSSSDKRLSKILTKAY